MRGGRWTTMCVALLLWPMVNSCRAASAQNAGLRERAAQTAGSQPHACAAFKGAYSREGVDGGWERLELSAEQTFQYERTIAGHERTRGRWTLDEESGVIVLEPTLGEKEPFPKMPARWQPVDWGERRYLVPEGRLLDFCNAINLGREPRGCERGDFPLREGDWSEKVKDAPGLPEDWRPLILKQPIEGRVDSFESFEGMTMARLNIGGNQGLISGMTLAAFTDDVYRDCRVKVLCPCDDTARVEILCSDAEAPGDLAVGDHVSTFEPFRREADATSIAMGLKIERIDRPPVIEPRAPQSEEERRWSQSATLLLNRYEPLIRARIPLLMNGTTSVNSADGPAADVNTSTACTGEARLIRVDAESGEVLFEWSAAENRSDRRGALDERSAENEANQGDDPKIRIIIIVEEPANKVRSLGVWKSPVDRRAP